MERHGVPIDMKIFSQLADKQTWQMVRDAMVPAIDAKYGVYVKDRYGDWTFSAARFEAYLARDGISCSRTSSRVYRKCNTAERQQKALEKTRHPMECQQCDTAACHTDAREAEGPISN
jgi:hypothetical protein